MKTFKKAIFVGILLLLVISTFAEAETNPQITIYTTSTTGFWNNSSTESLDAGTYNLNCQTCWYYEAYAVAELWNADTSTKVATVSASTNNPDDTDVTISAGNYYIKLTVTSGKGDNVWGHAGLSW